MIQIAIVDDERAFLESYTHIVEKLFAKNRIEFVVQCFYKSEEFYHLLKRNYFDIVFLDIDMPEINGINLAADIRKLKLETTIIFVSSHSNLVFQSIHYAPFRFIQKDCLEDDTSEAIHAYCQQIKEKKNTIQLKIENGETYCFNLMQIQYFYSVRHDLFLVYSNKKIAKRLFPRVYTMDALGKMLHKKGFIRIHKSYIVNFKYIHQIQSDKVLLFDNSTLPISRSNVANVKRQYKVIMREDDAI